MANEANSGWIAASVVKRSPAILRGLSGRGAELYGYRIKGLCLKGMMAYLFAEVTGPPFAHP